MRQSEDMPLDPEVLAELEAIDATLQGLAVDPIHAELAELSLLLAGEREQPSPQFIRDLDARAARRFEPTPTAARPAGRAARARRLLRRPSRPLLGGALVGALAVAVAAVVIANGSLSGAPKAENGPAVHAGPGAKRAPTLTSLQASQQGNASGTAGAKAAVNGTRPAASNGATTSLQSITGIGYGAAGKPATHEGTSGGAVNLTSPATTTPASSSAGSALSSPAPVSGTAAHQIQSAQLQLSTPNAHIDQVAQEVFNVVALENGTVQSSHVTQASGANSGGSYATFSLSVPTANLQEAMTRMSSLRYATVASRTDGTQNVSSQYATDQRNIADQKALRTSLLKQLQTAYTDQAIDSIKAQLKLVEQQLTADQNALGKLQHQISYSVLSVQVNAGPVIHPLATAKSKGFTLARAAHDSGRVLVVAAGVALIALALLVPLGLVAALLAWAAYWLRRRRREHALDAS